MPRTGAVVAGLICLDIIPPLDTVELDAGLAPGSSVEVGPTGLFTGGAVANTGRCMHRLGIQTHLVARVGDDSIGDIIRRLINEDDPRLTADLTVIPGAFSPSTLVISPPNTDRAFIIHSGTNHDFGADDVPDDLLRQVRLFHYGYPPYMRRMYENDGAELTALYRKAKAAGVITALDMAQPDAKGPSGQVNWRRVLERTLPDVDVFVPSLDELLFMLGHERPTQGLDTVISELGTELLNMGTRIVMLKLGEQGIYLRTQPDLGLDLAPDWNGRELWVPPFQPDQLAGTTGAGDAAIAGFLAALLYGQSAPAALISAAAVGACNVEAPDALGGIRSWEETQARIARGWVRSPLAIQAPGWRWDEALGCWVGPHDSAR